MCTKIFTKGVLQIDVEPHMRLHVSLIVKLFKTNRQKYPSPVEPSLKHRRAPNTSKTRGPRPTKPTPVGVGFWPETHAHWRGFERSGRISQRMHEDEEREKTEIRIRPSGGLYRRLYPDLAGCRGVKVLVGREFPIPSGL